MRCVVPLSQLASAFQRCLFDTADQFVKKPRYPGGRRWRGGANQAAVGDCVDVPYSNASKRD